ncbi:MULTISPECIES: hypothetical protein [unclassified Xanthomonas]|uniref:hypothetical protein n=1 Tax=unclassified Xanthomonas TaxID=2643310 RepID=UPI002A7F67EC|nr:MULTISPECIES: hypothetical protein [unclassified Xanthomonas]MDY4295883.1 hypothetical protein [Xanthomonas sp. LF02-5]MDY4357678.1 hypothetical protein [Xanthomonas sp. LF04-12]
MSQSAERADATNVLLYYLIVPESHEVLGPWADAFPAYTVVVGYSSLGHFFLHDPASQEYAVLHPFKAAGKSYGAHASTAAFEAAILRDLRASRRTCCAATTCGRSRRVLAR